jgi:glycosyl transferase family 25
LFYAAYELNSNSYINAFNFDTFDELINYIIKVDNDDKLYNNYFKESVFTKYWTNIFNDPNHTFFKNLVDNIVNFTKPNIKIVNLKRRPDRKELIKNQMLHHNIDNYEFYEAVDGSELIESFELQQMFERNDFNYKKGIIGCALSHINIWTQLINDDKNNYYVVLEDDIKLCNNFKQKLEFCCNEFEKYDHIDHLRLGDYDKTKKINEDINNLKVNINFDNCISNVTFAYIISKNGAQKIINFINKCSIKSAIDNPHSYGNVIRYNSLNENIVDCSQINNLGSDILYDNHP